MCITNANPFQKFRVLEMNYSVSVLNFPNSSLNTHLSGQFAARVAVVHDFVAAKMITVLRQKAANLLHVDGIVERRRVTDFAFVRRQLNTIVAFGRQ